MVTVCGKSRKSTGNGNQPQNQVGRITVTGNQRGTRQQPRAATANKRNACNRQRSGNVRQTRRKTCKPKCNQTNGQRTTQERTCKERWGCNQNEQTAGVERGNPEQERTVERNRNPCNPKVVAVNGNGSVTVDGKICKPQRCNRVCNRKNA